MGVCLRTQIPQTQVLARFEPRALQHSALTTAPPESQNYQYKEYINSVHIKFVLYRVSVTNKRQR